MDKIYDFLANNYVVFVIISVFILFVIIGILTSGKRKKKDEDPSAQPIKIEYETNSIIDSPIENNTTVANVVTPVIDESVPTLDAFASTATEVKIDIPTEEESNNESLLVIEDKKEEPEMLVIEDKEPITPPNNVVPQTPVSVTTTTSENTDDRPKSIFEE